MSDEDLYSRPLPMGEFFDRVVDQYDDVHTSHIDQGEAFYVAIAEPVTPTVTRIDVLSLGAGTGLDLVGVVERAPNAHLHCIDVAGLMLARLEARFAAAQVTTHQASYLTFDFPAAGYDYVFAAATLHHFTDDEKRLFYPKLVPALRPGGKLVVGDYYVSRHDASLFRAHYDKLIREGYDLASGKYHIDIPTTLAREVDLFRQAGFSSVEVTWQSSNYAILVVTQGFESQTGMQVIE